MDHRQAQATKATERYLLREMDEPERFAFETHYFDCPECAADVRAAAAFAGGVKAVYQEEERARQAEPAAAPAEHSPRRRWWWTWLQPPMLAPAAVAAALAAVVVYQSAVLLPEARQPFGAVAMAPTMLKAVARGNDAPVVTREGPLTLLSVDVIGAQPGAPLRFKLEPGVAGSAITGEAKAPPPGAPLTVGVPTAKLGQSGAWTLTLRNAQDLPIATYPFEVR